MLKLAIPVFHVSRSAAAEAFYCGKLGFTWQFAYRPTDAAEQDRVRPPGDRVAELAATPGRQNR